jgi:hypothetical protein
MAHESSQPAPVLITTYTRYNHLRQTVEALRENYLADQTDLFIASDYPKIDTDKEAVDKIRDYLGQIAGFKSVIPILREKNHGFEENFLKSKNHIYEHYDRIIFMEDDIVTAPGFLKFINDGLDAYQDNQSVYAICGYLYDSYRQFVSNSNQVFLDIFNAWGYGTWRDKDRNIERGPELSRRFLRSPKLFFLMNCTAPPLFQIAIASAENNLVAEDLDFTLNMIEKKKCCVFPFKSLVRNIGFDGSGVHCGKLYQDQYINQEIYLEIIEIEALKETFVTEKNRKATYRHHGGTPYMLKSFAKMFTRFWAKLLLPPIIYEKARAYFLIRYIK